MKGNLFLCFFVAILCLIFFLFPTFGQGVYIVQKKNVSSYEEIKNNFIQFSFVEQIPNLNTTAYYLDESENDIAILKSIAEKNPTAIFTIGSYAAKKVREIMPNVTIIVAMVYYPESEKLDPNEKTIIISSLGSVKDLMEKVKDFRKIKKVGVMYNAQISESANVFISELKSIGFEVTNFSFSSKEEIQSVCQDLKNRIQALIVLPDQTTLNSDVIRYIVTECISADVLPLSLNDRMVSSGYLIASHFSNESIGKSAAIATKEVATTGKNSSNKTRIPETSETSLNKGTLKAFKLKISSNQKIGVIYE